jgi:hypothetical protein
MPKRGTMKHRVAIAVLAAALLSGCSDVDWDHALSYTGLGETANTPPPAAEPATPAAAEPVAAQPAAPDDWCKQVAESERKDAATQGFDEATQRHRAEVTYKQCARSR